MNATRPLGNPPVTPAPAAADSPWDRLERAAAGKGVLDKVDLALIRALARRTERPADLALRAVLGCLIAAIRSGGLRIPLEPEAMAVRLEAFLESVRPTEAEAPYDPAGEPEFADLHALADRLSKAFAANRLEGAYAAILGEPPEFKPLLRTGGGLYFQKHQAAEASVSAGLAALLSAPDAPDPVLQGTVLDTVLRRFPLRLPAVPGAPAGAAPAMEFDPGQQRALAMALRKRFTVISGGPGTGKTSLAANLLRAWTRAWLARPDPARPVPAPPRIRLAAPTGRAAQRLAESLRRSLETVRYGTAETDAAASEAATDRFVSTLPCETLHALLRYNPGTGEYFHQRHRPLPADLVIVDEVSMVDIFALSRLLEALEEHATLVLLGDMDQLPSVEAGSVLADLVPEGADAAGRDHALKDNLAVLERSHRSEAGILDVTRRINAMDGAGALAALSAPLADPAAAWPIAFLEGGRKIVSAAGGGSEAGGGCRMLLPGGFADAPHAGNATPSDYRRGWDAWLESWVDFHYLEHSFDPARFPGRTLATPRRASYEALVSELCAFHPPADAAFHAGLAWKAETAPLASDAAPPAAPDAAFAAWLAALAGLFAYLDQARILTLTRKGWHGSVSVNRRIRERLARRWDPRASRDAQDGGNGFNGSPILILENDPAKGLFNGDVGALLRLSGRTLAFFRRADAYLAFPAAFLPRHEPAFAMTVHKSQGSEYDQALLVLPESGNRLLYKETLYTALTRARHFAGIYGPADVFQEAVARKVVRESGLPGYLGALARP
ncbi:MAG TPA: AAA family ATPase [Fibrobacteria bacterium]|nr:AAA family ATPase [Fibrobacteria bacterium]